MWILDQEIAELFPAISIGGPAANAFAAHIYEELPVTRRPHRGRVYYRTFLTRLTGGTLLNVRVPSASS